MAARSILAAGGRTATRSAPGAELQEPDPDLVEDNKLAAALQAQIDQLTEQLRKSDADLSTARADAAAARQRLEEVRAQLLTEAHQVSQDLAGERATSEGLRGQLETERQARAALQASLDHAVTAAATREPISFPKHEPVAYDVVMVNPETGERKQVSIKPAGKKG